MVLCVRWYVSYKLSYRDVVERMAERELSMAHTTIMRWVLKLLPTFEQRWTKYARPVGRSWRVDETYDPRSRAAGCICIARWPR